MIEALDGFLAYLLAPLDSVFARQTLDTLPMLFGSFNLWFWLVVGFAILRLQLPIWCTWLFSIVRPTTFDPPPWTPTPGQPYPRVAVIMPARDEQGKVGATIETVLRCGYPNLEIIVANDGSTDGTVDEVRRYQRTGRVRVVGMHERSGDQHSGKPSILNRALAATDAPYVLVLDADTEIQVGAIQHLLGPMRDPQVGAVTGSIRVRNARDSFATRFQECEYAMGVTVPRSWRSALDFLAIVPGGIGFFRRRALKDLGGWDTGLGEDTDMTLRLRKAGWKLRFVPSAVTWANVPPTWTALFRQRRRWERNMVKVRVRKQWDMLIPGRYRLRDMAVAIDTAIVRLFIPWLYFTSIIVVMATAPLSTPVLLTHLYWLTLTFTLIKMLIAHDLTHTPSARCFLLLPLLPLQRLMLRLVVFAAQLLELLRIGIRHPYVPDRIWKATPHW